jgi:putative transposase
VKQKSGLNQAILDQAWGEWRRQLEYKQEWRARPGGWRFRLTPAGKCPVCGHISPCHRRTQALFLCRSCGDAANADGVSSTNILSRGMEMLGDEGQDAAHACAGCEITARIAR